MKNRYKAIPRTVYQRKPEYDESNLPLEVSTHGAPPHPLNAYTVEIKGYTILDTKENTYRNYWYGRFTTTKEVAEEIVEMLNE